MSSIAVSDLRSSHPSALVAVARRLDVQRGRVVTVITVVLWRRAAGVSWSGVAASAAVDRYAALVGRLSGLATRLGATVRVLEQAGARLQAAKDLVSRADRRAGSAGGWVNHEGHLFLPQRVMLGDPVVDAHRARQDDLVALEVGQLLREAARFATDTDLELARDLLGAARGTAPVAAAGMLTVVPPPPETGPVEARPFASAAWWRALGRDEQLTVLTQHPEWVGPRDGVPAADRHAANLAMLDRADRMAAAHLAALEARRPSPYPVLEEADAWAPPSGAVLAMGITVPGRADRPTELARARARVDAVRAVRATLAKRDGVPRQLLLIDVSGPIVKAAVAVGDVDRAGHVSTFVGGLSTTVGGDLDRYDTVFSGLRERATTMAGEEVAFVTWMGYPAPQGDEHLTPGRSVLSARVARDHAGDLASFVNGIDASRDVPVDETVLGHSYGSVVVTFALARATGIDRVALFGSPGTGGSVGSVAHTGLKPGRFNVLAAAGDRIVDVGPVVLGPATADVAGATRLSTLALTVPGSTCRGLFGQLVGVDAARTSIGHSDYLRPGTDSATNLAALSAGRDDLVVPESADERRCR